MLETVCIHLLRYVIVSLILARSKDILGLALPVVDKMEDRFGDEFGELVKILGRSFAYEEVPEIVKRIGKMCETDYFLKEYGKEIVEGVEELVVRSYSKIYSVIVVDKLVKVSGLPADKAIEIALDEIKEHRTVGSLSEDKKTITVTLQDSNVNRQIAKKGNELEERTRKLIEVLKDK
eukprot:TRINITY_DN2563_c0_g2_i5.p2 TRINITY_DN2563_c0_g2~~TRINITY_DN2563_c0_g2_i5.p2  ORF type:complete len:178 (-),score=76.74 TRINITY_DN2563_c0_g2_i5:65-598(-)